MTSKLILLLIFFLFTQSPAEAGAKANVKKGNLLYNKGDFSAAMEEYKQALLDAPDSAIVNYNLGTALYKNKEYEKSLGNLEKALLAEEESLQQKASYNLGNAKYKQGISIEESALPQAVNLLKESLRHYERAIALDQEDEDAKNNYEFVKKELERLEKKLQQQKNDQKQQQEQGQSQQEQGKQESESKKDQKQKQQQEQKQQQAKEKQQAESEGQKGKEEKTREEKSPAVSQEEKPTDEKQQVTPEQAEPAAAMNEKEAKMLLRQYGEIEEPKGLYRPNIPKADLTEVEKDW